MEKIKFQTAEDYIAHFEGDVHERLITLRALVLEEIPEVTQHISFDMIGFKWHGYLFHMAAFQKHMGLYPGAETIQALRSEFEGYKTEKGTIQFPHNKPLPLDLIRRIVRYQFSKRKQEIEAENNNEVTN